MARAQESGRIFLLSFAAMARHYIDIGEARYKLRPKLHYIDHILENLTNRQNPRVLSNFLDEDFMGKIVKLARKQHRSCVISRTLQLYLVHVRRLWREWHEAQGVAA